MPTVVAFSLAVQALPSMLTVKALTLPGKPDTVMGALTWVPGVFDPAPPSGMGTTGSLPLLL